MADQQHVHRPAAMPLADHAVAQLRVGFGAHAGAQLRQATGQPAADLVDAGLGVRAAVDVDQPLQVGHVGGLRRLDNGPQVGQFTVTDHGRTVRQRPYTPATVRLVEIRLLDGPNLYRLEPAVRIELALGRRRSWYGQRLPAAHSVVHLSASVPAREVPPPLRELARQVRLLHRRALSRRVRLSFHRTSEPGHWVVAFPWQADDEAEVIANTAWRLLIDGALRAVSERQLQRIRAAGGRPPAWVTDAERRMPVVSISGTNGKSTTTRMISHIARLAGRRVGMTTTDGVLVDEQLVEPGDYTGPQGARSVLRRADVDLAVLETARGGILLRGLGYQSNDASVLTNISADHLDLQGIHTLTELAEVKSVICRVTRPSGAVVLNADDPLVAGVARRVRAPAWFFSLGGRDGARRIARHVARGGRAFVLHDGWLVERSGGREAAAVPIIAAADVPATLGGLARHNVANALAAAAGARALGFSVADVARGLRDFGLDPSQMPGRLNVYRRDRQVVIVDFAHNEAGLAALLDTAEALAGGPRGQRAATIGAIIGTAGDRPDDSLRAIGRIAGERADQVAIKESLSYLRGRSRESVVGELRAGLREAGLPAGEVPVYESETDAVRSALAAGMPDVLLVMCHAGRDEIERELAAAAFLPVALPAELAELSPALVDHRG